MISHGINNKHNPWFLTIAFAALGALGACKADEGDTDSASGSDSSGTEATSGVESDSATDSSTDGTGEPTTDAGTDSDSDSSTGAPTTTDTGAPFMPTDGAYALEFGTNGGTCAPDNSISGAVVFKNATVTAAAADGFTLALADAFDEMLEFACTLTGQDFSCTGPEVEYFMQTNPDARAAFMMSIAGTWTSATELSFTVTGELACTGDAAACEQAGVDWALTMPCTMTNLHTGTLGG